jgi:hypothetical protein
LIIALKLQENIGFKWRRYLASLCEYDSTEIGARFIGGGSSTGKGMLYEPQGIELFLRLALAAAFAIAGIVLLWQSHAENANGRRLSHTLKPRWLRAASAKPIALRPMQPLAPRLRPGAELGRLASVIDTARGHIQSINANQVSAGVQIDAAEHALNRLLGEISGIMPSVIKPTMTPRRAFEADAVANPEALAA